MNGIDLSKPLKVHFIGIGGISMSGLAEILLGRGFEVSGSDRAESPLTKHLSELGADIRYPQAAENIGDRDIDLVVYTAAIHPDNPEYVACVDRGLHMVTRAALLGAIMDEYAQSVAIAGTHGKTTTTSMVTQILLEDRLHKPTVSVGAIDPAIGSNVLVGNDDAFVAEACEYSNSFLFLHPTVAVVLNVEAEHLDFFKNLGAIRESFHEFMTNVKPGGCVVINSSIENYKELAAALNEGVRVVTYGLTSEADCHPEDIIYNALGCASFVPVYKGKKLSRVELKVPGEHNVGNACAAAAAAIALSENEQTEAAGGTFAVSPEAIAAGLSKFTGAKRRFEYRGTFQGATVVDDYAHHPTEIEATLKAAQRVDHKRLILVFQPHTYTRTKSFLNDFVRVLGLADTVVLAPIYAAREKDVYGIHSTDIRDLLVQAGKDAYAFDTFDEIEVFLRKNCMNGDLLITMGAGDVVKVADDITAG